MNNKEGYLDERTHNQLDPNLFLVLNLYFTRKLVWKSECRVCSCVYRLLAQLRDMEEAFDGFFEKHHLKLQQYLQLLHYEMSFQQV